MSRFRVALLALLLSAAAVRAAEPPSLTLRQCLQTALDHNPQISLASLQFLDTEGKVLRLHAILYPTLNAQALTAPTVLYVQVNQVFYSRATFPQLRLSRLAPRPGADQLPAGYRRRRLPGAPGLFHRAGRPAPGRASSSLRPAPVPRRLLGRGALQAGKMQKSAVLSARVTSDLLVQRGIGTGLASPGRALRSPAFSGRISPPASASPAISP